jgi:hypothetical protein
MKAIVKTKKEAIEPENLPTILPTEIEYILDMSGRIFS